MSRLIIPANPYTLLPPLLAALPASFTSSRPPPFLLPLLSPILRQRLQIHSTSPASSNENWLPLLCWDAAKGARLKDTVENTNFEPHPTSGEIEIGDTEPIKYRRFDEETLKGQIPLADWELTALFLWCRDGDSDNGDWKLAELIPFDSAMISDPAWSSSPAEANNLFEGSQVNSHLTRAKVTDHKSSAQGADDDDYWALYDGAPLQTPARQGSLAQPATEMTEDDYYARYGEVQPAMDNHDPDEEPMQHIQQPTHLPTISSRKVDSSSDTRYAASLSKSHSTPPGDDKAANMQYNQPIPLSPSSRAVSDTISRIEESAQRHNASEVGIRQHISTSVKSMYRLARSAGISRDDFDAMIQRELESLSMFDRDD